MDNIFLTITEIWGKGERTFNVVDSKKVNQEELRKEVEYYCSSDFTEEQFEDLLSLQKFFIESSVLFEPDYLITIDYK